MWVCKLQISALVLHLSTPLPKNLPAISLKRVQTGLHNILLCHYQKTRSKLNYLENSTDEHVHNYGKKIMELVTAREKKQGKNARLRSLEYQILKTGEKYF